MDWSRGRVVDQTLDLSTLRHYIVGERLSHLHHTWSRSLLSGLTRTNEDTEDPGEIRGNRKEASESERIYESRAVAPETHLLHLFRI